MSNTFRPHYHFTPPTGWINDPNGLVYFRGQWHLFYQYFQPADVDGMQWGHAVSTDLLHWQHLPAAILPDNLGQIWSGSAVVDHRNTSGLFPGGDGLVCLFTYWDPADGRQSQGLAYSADGLVFHKHPANPVIPQLRHLPGHGDDRNFRDPKVFWHEPTGRWVMAVAGGILRTFTSTDLVNWRFEHTHESIRTECPDLFQMPVTAAGQRLWVLSGGGRWYMLGDFDGRTFTPQTERIVFGHGPDYYATQTWSDAPAGRRVGISWLFNWNYDSKPAAGSIRNPFPTDWAGGCMTVPVELSVIPTSAGPRLAQNPVEELNLLRGSQTAVESLCGRSADLELQVAAGVDGTLLTIGAGRARECRVGLDRANMKLWIERTGDGLPANYAGRFEAPAIADADSAIRLRILLDRCSVEIFSAGGQTMQSAFIIPEGDQLEITPGRGIAVRAYPMRRV